MCLIIFAYNQHPDYRLILAANRDEFYERPTRPAAFWNAAPEMLASLIAADGPLDAESLFSILQDRTMPDETQLPDTGVGPERERILAPIFISSDIYGTRSSTILLWKNSHHVYFEERTFDPKKPGSVVGTVAEEFRVDESQD